MTLKSDAKFEEKPICCFKNGKNLIWAFFRAKYITFDQKKYRRVIFHDTEESCKIWRKTDWWFQKWHEELGNFHQNTWKCQNRDFGGILWHWRMMKIWRKIDFLFQNWHEELDEMWPEHFNGLLLIKVYNAWAKKSTEELSFMTMESDAKYEK